jgi:hypothetical protein
VGKSGKGRGVRAKHPSSSSPSRSRTEEGRGRPRPVVIGGGQSHGDGWEVGKMKRGSRATYSSPYLGRGRPV